MKKHVLVAAAFLTFAPFTVSNGSFQTKAANAQEHRGEADLHARIVDTHPPAARHEVRSARPSKQHVWLKGHYDHNGTDWAWLDGRWELPPAPKVTWVAPRYRSDHGKTRYEPAHWSNEHVIDEH
jgi:hypothetical protein